jgi:hypothetical protein
LLKRDVLSAPPSLPDLSDHSGESCGVDSLHLLCLNVFKHLFKHLIREGLPEPKTHLLRDYFKAAKLEVEDPAGLYDVFRTRERSGRHPSTSAFSMVWCFRQAASCRPARHV